MSDSAPTTFSSLIINKIIGVLDFIRKCLCKLVPPEKVDITENQIRDLISQGSIAGAIEKGEEKIVSKVFRLGDRPANSIMTSRQDIFWIDANDSVEKIWDEVSKSDYTYFPLADGDIEKVIGIISMKDLAVHVIRKSSNPIKSLVKEPLRLPSNLTALQVLDIFKQQRKHIALLIDEFGSIDGMVTLHDLMEAMVGDLADSDGEAPLYVKRQDGTLTVDAAIDLDDLFTLLNLPSYNHEDHVGYHSLGGFLLKKIGHLPQVYEKFSYNGFIFEIIELDKHRVSKILVKKDSRQRAA